MFKHSLLMFVVVFAVSTALTQFLAYQQYKISKETKRAELTHEAAAAKDRFRNVLFNDIAAANTLAIIYKQYGVPAKFDSVAHQIIQNSRYAEALQITENGIVRNVYPDISYKSTIGANVNADPARKAEEARAANRRDIYFAGPRRLRFGDTGILGKVPIITDNKVIAIATVLTRLPSIKKALRLQGADKSKFVYQLLKTNGKGTSFFLLSDSKPDDRNEYIDTEIPEGDWLLRVSYGNGYTISKLPFELSGLGFLFSFIAALLAYRKTQEPYKLNRIIGEKTEQLTKSERYFRTLIETSSDAIVLLDISGQVLYQSPSTEKILGYSLTEIQQMDGLQLIHPDDREEDNNIFYRDVSEPGAIVQRSHRIKHKNGNYIYIEGTYRNLLHDNNIKAIVYSYKDVTEKVLYEQELIESENRFRRAFEDSAIGMGLTSIEEDSMGQWLKVNKSLCEMLGYTEQELLSRTFMQITHPDDLARDLAAQDRILQGESDTYRLEKRYIHKDGSFVWINLNVSIIRGKDKKPIYLVAQIENITDKVESQIKFRNLVENFNVGVYILQNGKLVYVNPRVLEESGYTEQEIINMPFEKFIYKDDLEFVRETIEAREKGLLDTVRYEARIVKKDGQPLWYEIIGSTTVYHGAPALMGTMVNVSERKAVHEELIKSEANLRSIFDTTDVSYLLLDTKYNIIALNQQMRDIYNDNVGITLKEGDNLIGVIVPERREKTREIYDNVLLTKKPSGYEAAFTNNGVNKHFAASVFPIMVEDNVIGICISTIDVTTTKNALEKLKDANENLEKKAKELELSNSELEQFAYIASHDLQEPLRMVSSFMTQLERKYGDVVDDKGRQYIHFAVDGAKRMRQIILDLLEFSRVGRGENDIEAVNFNKLISDILPLYRRQVDEEQAKIVVGHLPTIHTYKTPLRQVFQNIIGNSLKYKMAGKAPVIEISCKENKTHFEFSVKDNGIGIAPEYFDKIFIIFQRLHNKDEYSGTGMGLAITKKIIESLGGKIWVESSEGNGSTFYFTLLKK
jgi:PAS domain S-box-containing protein